jgi:hypothetical protein
MKKAEKNVFDNPADLEVALQEVWGNGQKSSCATIQYPKVHLTV